MVASVCALHQPSVTVEVLHIYIYIIGLWAEPMMVITYIVSINY